MRTQPPGSGHGSGRCTKTQQLVALPWSHTPPRTEPSRASPSPPSALAHRAQPRQIAALGLTPPPRRLPHAFVIHALARRRAPPLALVTVATTPAHKRPRRPSYTRGRGQQPTPRGLCRRQRGREAAGGGVRAR
ncbi:hypothetical protein ZWY2020_027476 [Hordeum vulgare]|nr:hypothetical protein ZWY2020_027476 [Hordeum vulgare]